MAKHSTPEQLRADIDRGRTGDKVEASDPAAAPLGTDEEAAGTPTPSEALQQARDYENAMGRQVHGSAAGSAPRFTAVRIYLLAILAILGLILAVAWII